MLLKVLSHSESLNIDTTASAFADGLSALVSGGGSLNRHFIDAINGISNNLNTRSQKGCNQYSGAQNLNNLLLNNYTVGSSSSSSSRYNHDHSSFLFTENSGPRSKNSDSNNSQSESFLKLKTSFQQDASKNGQNAQQGNKGSSTSSGSDSNANGSQANADKKGTNSETITGIHPTKKIKLEGNWRYRLHDLVFLAGFLGLSYCCGKSYSEWTMPQLTADYEQKKAEAQTSSGVRKLTHEEVKNMLGNCSELSNEQITILSCMGAYEACREQMIREIMRVEKASYIDATMKVLNMEERIVKQMEEMNSFYILPIGIAFFGLVITVPLVYDLSAAKLTNDWLILAAVEDPGNLETMWEVSAWTWNWMEPALGTAAFLILCLQLIDGWMEKMGRPLKQSRDRAKIAKQIVEENQNWRKAVIRRFVMNMPVDVLDEEYSYD